MSRRRALPLLLCLLVPLAGAADRPAAADAAAAAEPALLAARRLARDGLAAHEAGDNQTFLERMTAAVALRPDYPRLLVDLAEAQVLNEQTAVAVATLGRLADLGASSPVEQDAVFAPLLDRKDFKAVRTRLDANLDPVGAHRIAFMLPDMTGLINGIAWRPKTGEYFFGDVYARGVWVRTSDGKVRRWDHPDDRLWAVLALAVDEEHGTLWAATSAVPGMRGYTADQDGRAGVAEFDLATGELRRVAPVPLDGRAHTLANLALAPDGTLFLPDSVAPVLWRLAPGAREPERVMESGEFISLQGVAVAPDGSLWIADHANGLLHVDPAARQVDRVEAPPHTTLVGLGGLALAPNGDLIAVQNGLHPLRVLRLVLDASGSAVAAVKVLESAHLTMAEPALGCVAGDSFVFIGNAGWSRFEGPEPAPTPPRPVPVFRTDL